MRIVDDAELHLARMSWVNDGSALLLVSLHLARGETLQAGAVARAALSRPDCEDAEEIERLLFTVDDAPEGWAAILSEFAAAPSIQRWRDIMRFVPLFLCACELGMTPDAIELVEEGLVDSSVILKRAEISGGARSTYLGLAATAAYLAGDIVGAIRFLRESIAHQTDLCVALPHIWFIREHASEDVNATLDQAGIPGIT